MCTLKGQFISSYFLVPKPDGKSRFILNLKRLNKTSHFKMEDIRTAIKLITRNSFMCTIDLQDAYFLVPVAKESRKYLRFSFNNCLYEFTCLPFGLCSAPYVFTKLLKPVAFLLRKINILSVFYLDDILILGENKLLCERHMNYVKTLLQSLGFILNLKKCQIEPKNICKFLGFKLNSNDLSLSLPNQKIFKIQKFLTDVNKKTRIKIRELAQLTGVLVAACPAVTYGWLYTKRLERVKFLALKKYNADYEKYITIPLIAKADIVWWINNITKSKKFLKVDNYSLEIFSDASLTGC